MELQAGEKVRIRKNIGELLEKEGIYCKVVIDAMRRRAGKEKTIEDVFVNCYNEVVIYLVDDGFAYRERYIEKNGN